MTEAPVPHKKLFYRIGEVCQRFGLEPHTLRSWEQEIPGLKPKKNRAGHRIYSENELALVGRLKQLIHEDGFTLAGAKRRLATGEPAESGDRERTPSIDTKKVRETVSDVREILGAARKLLEPKG